MAERQTSAEAVKSPNSVKVVVRAVKEFNQRSLEDTLALSISRNEDYPDPLTALPTTMPKLHVLIEQSLARQEVREFLEDEDLATQFKDYPVLGPYVYDDQSVYEGQYRFGLRHGQGKQVFADGCCFVGYWISDKISIRGIFCKPDGSYVQGLIVQGKVEGYVSAKLSNGDIYKGEWRNQQPEGKGTLESESQGYIYKGEFKEGMKHGRGIINWNEGTTYEGEFLNNHCDGLGKKEWYDGKSYEGSWKHGKMEGVGTFTWPDGRMYYGHYSGGKKNGQGEMYFPSGVVFKGTWKNGMEDGPGMIINEDGKLDSGIWQEGKRQ